MKNLLFYFVLMSLFTSCDKDTLEISVNHSDCIQEKINEFIQQDNPRSVKWSESDNQLIYKFSSLEEEVILNDHCDTICQYAFISSFLPPCKFEVDNTANWQTLWGG